MSVMEILLICVLIFRSSCCITKLRYAKENISNASTIDSLSVTEIEDAYQKFYDIIEGTIFEKLIINAFAGNV